MGAYFLSAFVLGVRVEEPASKKQILIEPHLGDLKNAQGYVTTPFGVVETIWKTGADGSLHFTLNVPKGIRAIVALPKDKNEAILTLEGSIVACKSAGKRIQFEVGEGKHTGNLTVKK